MSATRTSSTGTDPADAVSEGLGALGSHFAVDEVSMSPEVAAFVTTTDGGASWSGTTWFAKIAAALGIVGAKSLFGITAAAALGLGGAHAAGIVDLPVLPAVQDQPAVETPAGPEQAPPVEVSFDPEVDRADPAGEDGLTLPSTAADRGDDATVNVDPQVPLPSLPAGEPMATDEAPEPESSATEEAPGGDEESDDGPGNGIGPSVSGRAVDGEPQEDGRAFGQSVSDQAGDRDLPGTANPRAGEAWESHSPDDDTDDTPENDGPPDSPERADGVGRADAAGPPADTGSAGGGAPGSNDRGRP